MIASYHVPRDVRLALLLVHIPFVYTSVNVALTGYMHAACSLGYAYLRYNLVMIALGRLL